MEIKTNLFGKCGVYVLIESTSGKRYVGSSKNIYNRLQKHRSCLRRNSHQNNLIQELFNLKGESNFSIEMIDFCDEEKLKINEECWMKKLNPELNIVKSAIKHCLPEASKKIISETLKKGYSSGRIRSVSEKELHVYDKSGSFIRTFESSRKASECLKVHVSGIERVLSGKDKQSCGYIFSRIKTNFLYVKIESKKGISLILVKNGLKYEANSISEASRIIGVSVHAFSIFLKRSKKNIYKGYEIIRSPIKTE